MDYKEKQKEFRQRLKNQVKNIWVSSIKGTYNKSKHGLIGSKAI